MYLYTAFCLVSSLMKLEYPHKWLSYLFSCFFFFLNFSHYDMVAGQLRLLPVVRVGMETSHNRPRCQWGAGYGGRAEYKYHSTQKQQEQKQSQKAYGCTCGGGGWRPLTNTPAVWHTGLCLKQKLNYDDYYGILQHDVWEASGVSTTQMVTGHVLRLFQTDASNILHPSVSPANLSLLIHVNK